MRRSPLGYPITKLGSGSCIPALFCINGNILAYHSSSTYLFNCKFCIFYTYKKKKKFKAVFIELELRKRTCNEDFPSDCLTSPTAFIERMDNSIFFEDTFRRLFVKSSVAASSPRRTTRAWQISSFVPFASRLSLYVPYTSPPPSPLDCNTLPVILILSLSLSAVVQQQQKQYSWI